MGKAWGLLLLLAIAGCTGLPQVPRAPSACDAGEATYACQVERYRDVSV